MFEETVIRRKHGLNAADEPQVHISSLSMQQNIQSLGLGPKMDPKTDTVLHALEEMQKEFASLDSALEDLLRKISPILSPATDTLKQDSIVIKENASPLCMRLYEFSNAISSVKKDVENMVNRVNL